MNVPLIHDAIDLLRWRTAPLAQYQYPLHQVLAAFAALGVMTAAAAKGKLKSSLQFTIRGAVAFLIGLLISYAIRSEKAPEESQAAAPSSWMQSASFASSQGR